jgi:hypothetical protein
MATMRWRWRWRVAAIIVTAGVASTGCAIGQGTVACSMSAPPTNPVEVPRSWAYGSAVVVGTVGEDLGHTRTFSPGYRSDRHAFEVERVVAIVPTAPTVDEPRGVVTAADVEGLTEVANVHYPDQPPSCGGRAENASLDEGDRVLLILGPPQPTAETWTVGPAVSAMDLAGEPGAETATWQHRTTATEGGCDGHLTYDLAALEAAFRAAFGDPSLARALETTCTPD